MLHDLHARLTPYYRLKVAHYHRIRMGSGSGANQVIGVANGGDPIAQSLVERVLKTFTAGIDRRDLGAQQLHAEDVKRLALDVYAPHEYLALPFEERRHRGGGNTMLSRAGFSGDARLV